MCLNAASVGEHLQVTAAMLGIMTSVVAVACVALVSSFWWCSSRGRFPFKPRPVVQYSAPIISFNPLVSLEGPAAEVHIENEPDIDVGDSVTAAEVTIELCRSWSQTSEGRKESRQRYVWYEHDVAKGAPCAK